jgi:ketosteroid isomerase-like protein
VSLDLIARRPKRVLPIDRAPPTGAGEDPGEPLVESVWLEPYQQATLRSLGHARVRDLVQRYVDAWERGDVDAVVAMLAEDATFSMPPGPTWYRGRDAIASFLPRGPLSMRRRFLPVRANAQLAFGTYRWESERATFVGNAAHVRDLRGPLIRDVTCFLTLDAFPGLGRPRELPPDQVAAPAAAPSLRALTRRPSARRSASSIQRRSAPDSTRNAAWRWSSTRSTSIATAA